MDVKVSKGSIRFIITPEELDDLSADEVLREQVRLPCGRLIKIEVTLQEEVPEITEGEFSMYSRTNTFFVTVGERVLSKLKENYMTGKGTLAEMGIDCRGRLRFSLEVTRRGPLH